MDRCVAKKESIHKRELEQIEAQLNRTLKGYTYFIDKPNGLIKSKDIGEGGTANRNLI
jgi:hypothetical protein